MNGDPLLRELGQIADELGPLESRVDRLYRRRLTIWKKLRKKQPPIAGSVIAKASRVSESMVIKTRLKHKIP